MLFDADDLYNFPNIYGDYDDDNADEKQPSSLKPIAVFFLTIILLAVGFYLLYRFVPLLVLKLAEIMPLVYAKIVLICLFFYFAKQLFWLREKRRIHYALIELVFSTGTIFILLGNDLTRFDDWPAIGGAIYVIVRGFDNLQAGFKLYSPNT